MGGVVVYDGRVIGLGLIYLYLNLNLKRLVKKKLIYNVLNFKLEKLYILLDMFYLLKKIILGRFVILIVNFKKRSFFFLNWELYCMYV